MSEPAPRAAWLLLAASWIAAAVIINPVGNFPLNDDWAYGRVVESLHVLGRLQFPGEVAVSLVAQSLWGLLFVKLFGFSFSVLRLSTLVAGLAGVIFSFELFRALGFAPRTKWLGIFCVGFTPLYVSLSYTFMTDVFLFTACIGALLFYVRFVATGREHTFWLALLFSVIAVFTRDVGILVPASFWIARLFNRDGFGPSSWRAWAPLAVCLIALLGYQRWLVATDRMPFAYGIHVQMFGRAGITDVLRKFFGAARAILCYTGLLLFPVLLPIAARQLATATPRDRMRALVIGGIISAPLIAWTMAERSVLPLYVGNIFSRTSLGPVVMPFASDFLGPTSRALWMPVTLLAIAGAGLIAVLLDHAVRVPRRRTDPARTIVAVLAASYSVSLLAADVVDRYFLLLVPLTVVLTSALEPRLPGEPREPRAPRWSLALAIVLLAAMIGFAIAGTHDYLAWNRARWSLARDFFTREPPNRLEGGLEIEAWYAYPLERPFVSNRSWWWLEEHPYAISLGQPRRYQLVGRTPTNTWLPFGDGYIYLVRHELKIASGK